MKVVCDDLHVASPIRRFLALELDPLVKKESAIDRHVYENSGKSHRDPSL